MPGVGAGAASAIVAGSFLCIALTMTAIAASIVLSLISVYTSDHSVQGWGEEYRCNAMMLKLLYTNDSYNFSDGSIAYSQDFSNYCAAQFTNTSIGYIEGCVLANGVGWGPYNTSTTSKRRRRRDVTVGLYTVYEGRVFFSNKCTKNGDQNKYQNSSSLSSCVLQRLKYVNNLVNNDITTSNFKTWTSTPSFTISIVDTGEAPAYKELSPSSVYGVPRSIAGSVANSLGMSSTIKSELTAGCQYIGGLSISSIESIISGYESETTTSPPTVSDG